MLKTACGSLYVTGLLSFGAIAIESLDPYTGILLQLVLQGLGLEGIGLMFMALG